MKKGLKKVLSLAVVAAAFASLTACSDGELTASSAKSALKNEAAFTENANVYRLKVGCYETFGTDNLNNLAKLQAAGVIEFKVDTVTEYTKRTEWRGGWFSGGYVTVENTNDHYFVDVQLTEAGKKFIVDEKDRIHMRKDLHKMFKANQEHECDQPDYMGAVYAPGDEDPGCAEEECVEEVAVEEVAADSTVADTVMVVEEVAAPEPKKENKNAAYEAACQRLGYEEVLVRMGTFKVVKCYEVLCTEDMAKAGQGTCSFTYTVEDMTPFGYVYGSAVPGYLYSGKASFVHYNDLGWTVSEMSTN